MEKGPIAPLLIKLSAIPVAHGNVEGIREVKTFIKYRPPTIPGGEDYIQYRPSTIPGGEDYIKYCPPTIPGGEDYIQYRPPTIPGGEDYSSNQK